MMQEKELKLILREAYNLNTWKTLLPQIFQHVQFFNQPELLFEENKKVIFGSQIGSIQLDDNKNLAIFEVEVDRSINIVRNRVGLRQIAVKYIDQHIAHGALVFFYNHEQGDYRFTFIAKWASLDMETGEFKRNETKPKRYTYLFGDSQAQTTPARQLLALAEKAEKKFLSMEDVKEAFSLEALNIEFYQDYQQVSKKIIKYIFPAQINNKLDAHQGALSLLNRMMFVYFVQKKNWLMNDPHFLYHFWKDYRDRDYGSNHFHEKWLNKVFFSAFNGKAYQDPTIFRELPQQYHISLVKFPYLNGGLFSFHQDTDRFFLTDTLFEEIFDFFQKYNFTIIEDSDEEVSLEINPELLGKMYEGMINATDLDDVDAENGIVYTERPEINFMTRRGFVEVLDKKLNGKYTREFLYHFCFNKPENKLELLKKYKVDANELIQTVLSITALDPTCGSGSMLIGVIQLQVELIRSLYEYLHKPLSYREDYNLKKQIISECIYGVDIKEWAVRIAELRFWLYMISEAEFTADELIKEPLLPNLDFKLRQGDSLIQELGNIDFSIKGLFQGRKRNEGSARKLNEFIKKKKAFITNQSGQESCFEKLKEEELHIFKAFIKELIFENEKQIASMNVSVEQRNLFGVAKPDNAFKDQIEKLEKENEQFKRIQAFIRSAGRLPFSYDIDFMEIFLLKDNPGFDFIIGNPPYVRQEDILPAGDALELERLLKEENKEEKKNVNKAYKEKLSSKVFEAYPFLATTAKTQIDGENKNIDIYGNKVPGRSDFYVYFQLLCPLLLNRKGTFCFIISNSWLDVGYGGFVQHFLLKHTHLYGIYDCNVRSFDASINTIIYLHSSVINDKLSEKQIRSLKPSGDIIHFVMNKAGYTDTAYAPLLIEQEHCKENTFRPHYRVIVKSPIELWEEAFDKETHSYQSNKWGGKYLRAPEIYFTILEKGKDKLVPLKEIADVRRGITTGANEFFYLPNKYFDLKDNGANWKLIPKGAGLPDDIEIEKEYLKPILFSLKEAPCPNLSKCQLNNYYFSSNLNIAVNKKTYSYVKWGEKNNYHKRPSCTSRRPFWYSLDNNFSPALYIFPSKVGERFMLMDNSDKKVIEDKKQYGLNLIKIDIMDEIFVFCNSTLYRLLIEQISPQLTGAQAISDITTKDYKNSPCLKMFSKKHNKGSFRNFIDRKQESVFVELGFNKNIEIRSQTPNPLPDRKELDDIIFDELGLTEEERNEVYWATAELVKQRLDKAASRKK